MKNVGVFAVSKLQAVGNGATAYSNSIPFKRSTGNVAALIVLTAGSITITKQASIDNTNWYDIVDPEGTAVGAVVAAMTVGSKYIVFTPVVAPFMRFKIVEGGVDDAVVSISFISQEEIR